MDKRVSHRIVIGVTALAGLFLLGQGIWALVSPQSFFDEIALFPPYNRHFLHDAGVFQIGLGATLLLALIWRDALLVALAGVGLGATAHAVSHVVDHGLGGRDTDPYSLGLLAAVLIAAAFLRWRDMREAGP